MSFEEWSKGRERFNNASIACRDDNYTSAKMAWNHQQKKIDELEDRLGDAVDLLDDAYDTYNVEEIGEFLQSLEDEKEDE